MLAFSDDDLEPYDLSNDTKVQKIKPPVYVRDCMEGEIEIHLKIIYLKIGFIFSPALHKLGYSHHCHKSVCLSKSFGIMLAFSDDDLQPYDLSNDTKVQKINLPFFSVMVNGHR